MKMNSFAWRNSKEIMRDKLNLFFGLAFPIIILLLLTLIQSNIPVDIFSLERLTPGITVFGLSFLSLFSGIIISKDRASSLMLRLFASPMAAKDFILGYTLPLIPMAILQSIFCYLVAILLGLKISVNILLAVAVNFPADLLFIAVGLLCGTIFNEKQVGGFCGAMLTNVTAWLSGTWFDLALVGKTFQKIADLLPFSHAVNAGRMAMSGNLESIWIELLWVLGYAVVLYLLVVLTFMRKMKTN